MKANPNDQLLLLDVADIDRRIAQAESARKNPPQAARVQELIGRRTSLGGELAARAGARDDLKLELKRVEADVEVVTARRARDADRLETAADPKVAQGLESEIVSLDRRRSDLETTVLELMEKLDTAEAALAEQQALMGEVTSEGQRLSAEAREIVAASTATIEALTRDRGAVVGKVPADLIALYERLRERGTGTALFTRGMCGACNVMLSPSDLQKLRDTPDDEVALCPECGGIMVRTHESGLARGSGMPRFTESD